jgi:hypothetical protein
MRRLNSGSAGSVTIEKFTGVRGGVRANLLPSSLETRAARVEPPSQSGG